MTINQLTNKFEEIYQGSPWHGASLLSMLNSVPEAHFSTPVNPGRKSISDLLEHIVAWRQFAIEKLKDNGRFDIPINSEADWPEPRPVGDPKEYYLNMLSESQQALLLLLKEKSDAWLKEKTPNKTYNNGFLIQGIVEHDLYHSGQIGIFNALLKAQNSSN